MILISAYILQALKFSKKHQGFLEGEEPTGSTLDQEMAGKYIVNMVSQRDNYVTTLKHNRIHENSTKVPASEFQTQSSTWHRTECQQVESPRVQNPKKISSSTIFRRLKWHIVQPTKNAILFTEGTVQDAQQQLRSFSRVPHTRVQMQSVGDAIDRSVVATLQRDWLVAASRFTKGWVY